MVCVLNECKICKGLIRNTSFIAPSEGWIPETLNLKVDFCIETLFTSGRNPC